MSDPKYQSMFPRVVNCEGCGQTAIVRAYVPIYDEPRGLRNPNPDIMPSAVQLTIDCSHCGIGVQTLKLPRTPSSDLPDLS